MRNAIIKSYHPQKDDNILPLPLGLQFLISRKDISVNGDHTKSTENNNMVEFNSTYLLQRVRNWYVLRMDHPL